MSTRKCDRLVDDGMPRAEARRRALASFGGLEPMRERARDARGTRWVEESGRTSGMPSAMMRGIAGFTLAAIVSLAIGIGANTAHLHRRRRALLRALPVERPAELAFLKRGGYDEQILRSRTRMYVKFRDAVPDVPLRGMGVGGTRCRARPEVRPSCCLASSSPATGSTSPA